MTPNEENVSSTPKPETSARQTPDSPSHGYALGPGGRRTAMVFATIGLVLLAAVIYLGIHSRAAAESRLKQRTEEAAVPIVTVIYPKEGAPTDEIVLPGVTQAFTDSPIYARTNGYLKQWYFDIGAHVKKDQLLAVIDTPEIDQQLQQARADLDTAQANVAIAKITADRWQGLVSDGSVSQQETDQAVINLKATQATSEASAANVRRLEQLQSFEKVYAPFDGIITARSTDIGALIDAGAGGSSATSGVAGG
ncbi:MAG: efflux RND transporter periplasmic adaptor subunit, partial [Candidatus Acidiferrum sp.]